MFERLNTPEEAYDWQLGAALKLEQTVLEENLQQEQHTLEEVKEALERVTAVSPKPA